MASAWCPHWGTRTFVMGVVNVTPDSFTGDGLAGDCDGVRRRGERLVEEGADLIDVGGESTRPFYTPVSVEEELLRVIPAVRTLAESCPLPLSIDTTKAEVARHAIEAGACVVNDVSGLRDPLMSAVVADAGCTLVLVHDQSVAEARDVTSFVRQGLEGLVERALRAGIAPGHLVIDPGLGFGKTWRQNLEIVNRLAELRVLGLPLLVGPSRKATISRVLGVGLHDRTEGTAALVAVSVAHGADSVRVHDCVQMARVARTIDTMVRPR